MSNDDDKLYVALLSVHGRAYVNQLAQEVMQAMQDVCGVYVQDMSSLHFVIGHANALSLASK